MSTQENQQAPERVPCANKDCGFAGFAGFQNYCSVCFKQFVNKAPQEVAQAKKEQEETPSKMEECKEAVEAVAASQEAAGKDEDAPDEAGTPGKRTQKNKSKCFECKKKVGILGFECRCGFVYCGKHRYPEEHKCEFNHAEFDKNRLAANVHKVEAKKLDVL